MPVYEISYHHQESKPPKYKLYRDQAINIQAKKHLMTQYSAPSFIIVCSKCHRKITHFTSMVVQRKRNSHLEDLCVHCFIYDGVDRDENKRQEKNKGRAISQRDSSARTQNFFRFWVRRGTKWSLTQKNWKIRDEICLLNAIDKFGYGNWEQIMWFMKYCGCNFSTPEIQSHYSIFYLESSTFQPILSSCLLKWSLCMEKARKKKGNQLLNSISINQSLNQNNIDVIGYKWKRDEFAVQYDSNAEKMVADLEFKRTDTPQQKQLKQKMLMKYCHRVQERYKRYKYVLEHNLLNQSYYKQKVLSLESHQTKAAERTLKPFSRFSSFDEHKDLVRSLSFQKQLMSLIKGIKKCRKTEKRGRVSRFMSQLEYRRLTSPKSMESKYSIRSSQSIALLQHYNKFNQVQSQEESQDEDEVDIIKKRIMGTPGFTDSTQITLIKPRTISMQNRYNRSKRFELQR